MRKAIIVAAALLLAFPIDAHAHDNPMFGKWTRDKGDCKSFVYEYAPDAHYYITRKLLFLTKRKTFGGEISYKVDLPFVEYIWVQTIEARPPMLGMKWVHTTVVKFTGRDVMREVFHSSRGYLDNELMNEEWEKEDGTHSKRVKNEGKWHRFPGRRGLFTKYRCH
jgi:hypothetical protein